MSVNVIKQNDHETMVPELPRERLFSVKWKEAMRSTHHVLPGILPRCDEDIVPGQRQQQSQRNHIEFKVPNNDDKKLWRGRKHKTVSRRKVVTKKKKNSVCEECIHSRPHSDPHEAETPESAHRPYVRLETARIQRHSYAESEPAWNKA